MTLLQLSRQYRRTACLLGRRARDLEGRLGGAADEQTARSLQRRILLLSFRLVLFLSVPRPILPLPPLR